jgi:peroxiredoxin
MGIRFRWRLVAGVLAAALVALGANKKPDNEQIRDKASSLVGKPAPDLVLPDLNGKQMRLSDSHGHVVLLVFWGTWCPPCRSEIPHLAKLQREMAEGGKEEVVLVARDSPAKVRDFLAAKKLDAKCLVDESGTVFKRFGAQVIPKAFVVGQDGTVLKFLFGKQSEDTFRRALAAGSEH